MKLFQNKYPISDNAKYVVDYVYDSPKGEPNFYYQLVRLKDNAILCAYYDKKDVIIEAWSMGIKKEEVAFI